jgi:cyclic pyranopterin phosphate synthase
MVDVSGKPPTTREATAEATLTTREDVIQRIATGDLPKGDVLATARVAGILAAKRTSDLIPLCHPLPLAGIDIALTPTATTIQVTATVRTTANTGVEMEALTAASVAGLTLYDMIKAVDREATVTNIRVTAKSGGRHGTWTRET